MPWLSEAKKDVIKARKGCGMSGTCTVTQISEWGNPDGFEPSTRTSVGERGELKHLSNRRKRK